MLKRFFVLLLSVVLLFTMTACFPGSFIFGVSEGMTEGLSRPADRNGPSLPPSQDVPRVETESPKATEEPKEEILFCDIPWGCDPATANELLGDRMTLMEDTFVTDWSCSYKMAPVVTGGGHVLFEYLGDDVAGHSVFGTRLYFMYALNDTIDRSVEASKFYMAQYQFDVVDIGGAYDDLKSKLTSLYGEGKEEIDTITHWVAATDGYSGEYDTQRKTTTWIGKNNTKVVLTGSVLLDDVEVFAAEYLYVTYGKTDADQRLEDLNEAIKEEKAREEANNRNPDNTNGL